MLEGLAVTAVVLAVVVGGTIVLTPIARALGRRIGGDGAQTERRLAALEAVVADLQDDHGQLLSLEDRVARAERRFGHATGRTRRSDRPSQASDPKVGKLWTPPPYKA